MVTQVKELFSVQFFHEYYKTRAGEYSSSGADLDISPSEYCARILKNHALLYVNSAGGFTVTFRVGDTIESKPRLLIPLDHRTPFSFYLKQNNPYLLHYSNLPIDKGLGYVYYINNLTANIQAIGEKQERILTKETNDPWISSKDLLPLHTGPFQYSASTLQSHVTLSVYNEFAERVIETTVAAVDGSYTHTIDLTGRIPGQYVLLVDGDRKKEFYFDPELQGNRVFGIVTIFAGPDIPAAYQYVNVDHSVSAKTYQMYFNTRKTIWKYYVGLKYKKDIEPASLSLQRIDPLFSFEKKELTVMGDGIMTIPFISTGQKFPLKKEPVKGFRLEKTTTESSSAFIVDNLPNPSVRHISRHDNEECSEMFIYI
jgi:hypothetical protein